MLSGLSQQLVQQTLVDQTGVREVFHLLLQLGQLFLAEVLLEQGLVLEENVNLEILVVFHELAFVLERLVGLVGVGVNIRLQVLLVLVHGRKYK